MNDALGDFIFSQPTEREGDQWTGRIQSIGAKVIKFTTYKVCDLIVYNDSDIVDTLLFEDEMVHKLWSQNITKIEGVY